ncbi:MAG: Lrp/AsnC ligand binding domain-containing protein [bacterium]
MVTGLVLVKLSGGKERQAIERIKDTKGVSHVTAVFGRWDLVIDVETDDLQALTSIVAGKIRSIPGVFSTETLVTTAI